MISSLHGAQPPTQHAPLRSGGLCAGRCCSCDGARQPDGALTERKLHWHGSHIRVAVTVDVRAARLIQARPTSERWAVKPTGNLPKVMRKRWLALVVLGASTTAGLHSAADFLSESAARVVKSHLYECTIGSPGHGSTIDHHSIVLDFTCFLKPCPLHEDCTECYTLCTLLRHCKAATVFVSLDGQARGSFFLP